MMARAPGVGPKLAARLVLELKDKAPALGVADFGGSGGGRRREPVETAEGGRGRDPRPRRARLCPPASRRRRRQDFGRTRAGGADGGARQSGLAGAGAMSGDIAPRGFFLPMIGLRAAVRRARPADRRGAVCAARRGFEAARRRRYADAAGLHRCAGGPYRRADRGLCHRRRAGRGDRLRLRALGRRGAGAGAPRARRGVHRRPHHLWRRAQTVFARRAVRADDPRPCRFLDRRLDRRDLLGPDRRRAQSRPSSPAAPSPPSSARSPRAS